MNHFGLLPTPVGLLAAILLFFPGSSPVRALEQPTTDLPPKPASQVGQQPSAQPQVQPGPLAQAWKSLGSLVAKLPKENQETINHARQAMFDAQAAYIKARKSDPALAQVLERQVKAFKEFEAQAPANPDKASRELEEKLKTINAEIERIVDSTPSLAKLKAQAATARDEYRKALVSETSKLPEGARILEEIKLLQASAAKQAQ